MRLNKSVKNERRDAELQRFRLNLLITLTILLSFVLIIRLAYLQISQFKRYQTLSLKNQMNVIPIAPPRGIILDRNGIVLAENIPVYVLEIIPERVKNMTQTLEKLKGLLPSITEEDIDNFHKTRKQNRSFIPIPLKLKLNQEEVAIFASNQYQFPGVNIKARLMRYYPLGEVTSHILGYVGRINVQELRQVDSTNYRATNFIGKSGIEKFYEDILHGEVGYQQVEIDVSGRTVRVLNKKNPVSGEKLYLTIDSRLQQAAFEALKEKRGAVVAINTKNGEILAMASSPSYDPNIFVNGITAKEYQQLTTARDKPLYNRAVRGLYPPASTIKPFMGLAGLEKGVIDARYSIYDPGWFRLPGVSHAYRDWKKTGHGIINLKRAITVSCDTYFYQLGHKMGIAAIEDMLVQFGFGQLTHVDLNEEAPGLVPNKHWKLQNKGVSWYPGDTVITSIGQGFMLASPLQLANATASLSQKGKRFRPHLLQKSVQSDNGKMQEYKILEEYPMHLKDDNYWTIVAEGMLAVITSNEGTGYRFGRTAPYSVAAKTGTAQVFGGHQYEKVRYEDIPEYLRDNSLFIAFAPYEDPEIALAVVVENDFAASNVARKVLDAYFELKKNEEKS
ncbi:penicillin-binding protein 2 [Legionella jamestowniensis]|uniref:Peptidoglycan D,D-transpeptidase MrdA n=1 Tax=Legionella jamestowniensis TaxID=455 RepID=A0A0W0UNM2_9GAMM|nr:penicillin-binding protein 2 [Legionella jamestowniensis]KTD09482.1 penicillin-binding protein 2 [Legionella jamestowniensis]OCH99303.1 penicillin-binding protein 2 [Legionella jamestowniensis]SFL90076.1 peptidoglycan glycosyltransferase [Legionella jamestowniensis DSM 19215]